MDCWVANGGAGRFKSTHTSMREEKEASTMLMLMERERAMQPGHFRILERPINESALRMLCGAATL